MGALKTYISADSHMLEPGNLWQERLPREYRDRAPHVYYDEEKQTLFFGGGGVPATPAAGLFVAGATDEELPEAFKSSMEKARPGGWDPAERLKDMAIDGVAADVLYTSLGFNLFWLEEAGFQEACFRVYNDWLAEFCSYDPQRFVGLALISLFDVDNAIKELDRCKKLGLRGAMIWASPPDEMSFFTDYHDKFWAAAQDLDMPVSLHILTGQGAESRALTNFGANRFLRTMALPGEIQRSLTQIIFSGTFERFPKLKVVSAENDMGWVPYWLYRADRSWKRFRFVQDTTLTMLPSDYFRRNVWVTFIDDPAGLDAYRRIGADRIMWSNDYPHQASTWPHSLEVMERDFVGVAEEDKVKICRDNAAALYGFDVSILEEKPLSTAAAD